MCRLKRKRCACGKQVKAIELTRDGACGTCVRKKEEAAKAARAGVAVAVQ